jgi:hypothetical protein
MPTTIAAVVATWGAVILRFNVVAYLDLQYSVPQTILQLIICELGRHYVVCCLTICIVLCILHLVALYHLLFVSSCLCIIVRSTSVNFKVLYITNCFVAAFVYSEWSRAL